MVPPAQTMAAQRDDGRAPREHPDTTEATASPQGSRGLGLAQTRLGGTIFVRLVDCPDDCTVGNVESPVRGGANQFVRNRRRSGTTAQGWLAGLRDLTAPHHRPLRRVGRRWRHVDCPPVPRNDEILAAEQVAQLLQLNIDYVRKLSREGTIPAHRLHGGRTFRYFKREVLGWLRGLPIGDDDEDGD